MPVKDTGPLLPPGVRTLEGACAGQGWVLCWRGARAWGWSPGRGWIGLPGAEAPIREGHVVAEGFLAVVEKGRRAGFWRPGDPGWAWWFKPEGHTRRDGVAWFVDGSLVAILNAKRRTPRWTLYRIGHRGLVRVGRFSAEECEDPGHLRDRGSEENLYCGQGIARFRLGEGTATFDRSAPFPLKGWPPSRQELASLRGMALDGDRERLAAALSFLEAVPDAPSGTHRFLALLDGTEGPVAAATTAGLLTAESVEGDRDSRGSGHRYVAHEALLPLWLVADPVRAAPEAAGLLLRGGGRDPWRDLLPDWTPAERRVLPGVPHAVTMVEAFGSAFGSRAPEVLADAIRGCGPVERPGPAEELEHFLPLTVRGLFADAGTGAREVVRRLLAEADPALLQLGGLAAGADALGLAPALSGKAAGPEDVALRNSFHAALRNPEAEVRLSALDSCAELRLPGVLPVVAERLRDEEEKVRQAAVRALLRAQDAGEPERALAWGLLGTETEGVRRTIVEEVGETFRATDLDLVVEGLGDPADGVRLAAAETVSRNSVGLAPGALRAVLEGWLVAAAASSAAVSRRTDGFAWAFPVEAPAIGACGEIAPDEARRAADFIALEPAALALKPDTLVFAIGDWVEPPPHRSGNRDEYDAVANCLEEVVPGIVPVAEEAGRAIRAGGTSRSLARLSGRLAPWDAGLAGWVAVVALLREENLRAGALTWGPLRGKGQSLAKRLQGVSTGEDGLDACERRVRALSRTHGPLPCAALLVLALRGEREAREELVRRIETGEVAPWWSTASALAGRPFLLGFEAALELAERSTGVRDGGHRELLCGEHGDLQDPDRPFVSHTRVPAPVRRTRRVLLN